MGSGRGSGKAKLAVSSTQGHTVPGKLSPNGEICLVRFIYLRLCAALCCVRVVVHLVGEQGHEEREAADVPRSRLSTVERLRVNRSTRFLLLLN